MDGRSLTAVSGDVRARKLPAGGAELQPPPPYPSLYQINTRVWLTELSRGGGAGLAGDGRSPEGGAWEARRATLDDIPDAELDRVAAMGFDWVWLLSVWNTGPAGQRVSRTQRDWRREFRGSLPRPAGGGTAGARL